MVMLLRPERGGFRRPFGCGQFIYAYLSGRGPYDSPVINPSLGAPQADIFYYYKKALIKETALNMATTAEEKLAKREKRPIDPDTIESSADKYLEHIHYKSKGCRYHSFVTYFSLLIRLEWVEFTGRMEQSEFYSGQSRRYYRLTSSGTSASDFAWANPYRALYG
jgi:hypothetical protein